MLKGPGDFSPEDPLECPEECEHLDEDGECMAIDCIYEPPDEDTLGDERYHRMRDEEK